MAKQTINIGSAANDASGDTLRAGATKINENFTELYTADTTFISLATLKTEVAASADFAAFKARIAAL
jgi:hypothetical protein|tara:strand:+ start:9650 stop:9853 length:204 start_codon:yes stop_codon:yes gene_type:complete